MMFRGIFSFIFPWLTPHLPEQKKSSESTLLHAESILLEEFNYISVTAYQLKEGRGSLFNLYLIIVGITTTVLGTIATLYPSLQPAIGTQTVSFGNITRNEVVYGQNYDVLALVIILLVVVSFLSSIFFLRFIHISKKYRDCLIAIEKIKEYYKMQFALQMPSLKTAFHWNSDTIPSLGSIGSFMFLVGSLTVVICIIYFDLAIYLTLNGFLNVKQPTVFIDNIYIKITTPIVIVIVSIILILIHWIYYRRSLLSPSPKSRNKRGKKP